MQNISMLQAISDRINANFSPRVLSAPGKNELTIIINGKNDTLREYKITAKDGHLTDLIFTYSSDKAEKTPQTITDTNIFDAFTKKIVNHD